MCWPMSALPQVTVTRPSGAIAYQTLGSKFGGSRSERFADSGHAGIAEHEAGGGGADQEGAAAEICRLGRDVLHVLVHVGLRSLPAADAVRISVAARMIAFWIRE